MSSASKNFLEANKASPVVYGSAQTGGGIYYRLESGQRFRLSARDCRGMPKPWWLGEDRNSAAATVNVTGTNDRADDRSPADASS